MKQLVMTRRSAWLAGAAMLMLAMPASAQMAPPPAAPAQTEQPTAAGLWQQIDDQTGQSQGWFLIGERNGLYEGKIAKMFSQPGDPPNPVCEHCEGEQRGAPWLGLTIITNMKRDGLKYEDGRILDPRDGTVYRALMRLSPDGQTLTVRGYLGISLLGRDQVWQRLPETAYAELDPSVYPQKEAAKPAPVQRKARTQGGGVQSAPRAQGTPPNGTLRR
ncbi:MAG TPA: DUF2147 domain-containing protein [Xanthobacteraceae bacterium]|nr:DUF2147 domain-containing protein [Xanthobacteraceae bacterium]